MDQAAVLGVVLAASVTISTAGEAWELIESVVGLVLLLLIAAYFETTQIGGSRIKLLALAAVSALCCCIVVAYPIQCITKAPLAELTLPIVWVAATVVITGYLMIRELTRLAQVARPKAEPDQADAP